jgi:hypothetical protein
MSALFYAQLLNDLFQQLATTFVLVLINHSPTA